MSQKSQESSVEAAQPTASRAMMEKRAQLLKQLRSFFDKRGVLEVEVPSLGLHTVTDVQLSPLAVCRGERPLYLQTSPEYYLKRLIARDKCCVYSLGKAYRSDESGRLHRAEFTLLEWYRMDMDDRQLMDEVQALFATLQPEAEFCRIRYAELFEQAFQINPHRASIAELQGLARNHTSFAGSLDSVSEWLDLLFSFCIEPTLTDITFVYDYPACQSALARSGVDVQGNQVAHRFEVFWQGVELGNGYWELSDPQEQLHRFREDNAQRKRKGFPTREIDPNFVTALKSGLPNCSGIAIGVDRLLMCLEGQSDVERVISFANF